MSSDQFSAWPSGALAHIIDAAERQMDGEDVTGRYYIRIKRNQYLV